MKGVAGLFVGYGSFLLRDLPFDAIEFAGYESLKKAWGEMKGEDGATAVEAAAQLQRAERSKRLLETRLTEATRTLVASVPSEELSAERGAHQALQRAYPHTSPPPSPSPSPSL